MTDIFELINVGFDGKDSLDVSFSESLAAGGVIPPSVSVTDIEGGHRVTVSDADSETSFDVMDGISPKIEVTSIEGGHRVTVTDADGTVFFDVMDGIGTSGEAESGGTDQGSSAARGILSFERTSGDGSAGSSDTYTITYTDGTSSVFTVYNGSDGVDGKNGKDGTDATVTKESVEAVLTGDVTSHSHSQYLTEHQDVSGLLSKSGGTMIGALKAHSSVDYTVYRVRNIAIKTAAETPSNGDLLAVYSV